MRTTVLVAAALLLLVGTVFATADDHLAPADVAATCGSGFADVTWSPVDDEHLDGYDVYRRAAGDPSFVKVNLILVEGTEYTDLGLQPGTTYEYALKSIFDDGHQSPFSGSDSCTIA